MRVLLAETNWNAMTAAAGLTQAGLLVTRVDTGTDLLEFSKFGEQSAIVFDLDLGDIDGLESLKTLRATHPQMPIYVLTSDTGWTARKAAFENGADDVFSGAVDVEFLAAKIKAAVRRSAGYSSGVLSVGQMDIDTHFNRVTIGSSELQLTRKEYEIVELLALNRELLVTRETFMNQLYAWEDEPDGRIINVYLSRIRNQIEACGGAPEMLETVWGLGYRITATPHEVTQAA